MESSMLSLSFFSKYICLFSILFLITACGTENTLDSEPPVVTLNGLKNIQVEFGSSFVDPGAEAFDRVDGALPVIISGSIDTARLGEQEIVYKAEDRAGNVSEIFRIVEVIDSLPPQISLKGQPQININQNEDYIELGVIVTDFADNDLDIEVFGEVNVHQPGVYELKYVATDESGNTSEIIRTVIVADITSPAITLIGGSPLVINHGSEYLEPGYRVTDNVDTAFNVTAIGFVDTNELGYYQINYEVVDSSGNKANVVRVVEVVDGTPPQISLIGGDEITIKKGTDYVELGAMVSDNVDSEVDLNIVGEVNTLELGTYTIVYSAEDAAGNSHDLVRTVIVRPPYPFITQWKTDNLGVSEDNQVHISTATQDQNYTIDWGDGTVNTGVNGDITHTYENAGVYTVSISGDFHNIQFSSDLSDNKKLISVEQWGEVQWSTMENAFKGCSNLVSNASDVPQLTRVENFSGMFFGAYKYNQEINDWNVSSATNKDYMFASAYKFNSDLSNWDVSQVTSMKGLFSGAKIFDGDISSWDVSSVESMKSMFSSTTNFNSDISNWDVSSVNDMSYMFSNSKGFNGDISRWNVSNVVDMSYMFSYAESFMRDINQWNVSSVKNMAGMFYWNRVFTEDLYSWNVSSVEDMSGMFYKSAYNGDISQWDVSSVTHMFLMFASSSFDGDISQWDVSSVIDMNSMFRLSQFSGSIEDWNVSNVLDMSYMFNGARNFNSDISVWNVSSVRDMGHMFDANPHGSSFNQDLGDWDVSSVVNMEAIFRGAEFFESDLSKWDVSSVVYMNSMFSGASSFNSDLSKWDVSSVVDMSAMFSRAISFNSELSEWVTSSVIDMQTMFSGATSFDSNLGGWDIGSVIDFTSFLNGVSMSVNNYDSLLIGWASQAPKTNLQFSGGVSKYSTEAELARSTLINTFGWSITDRGLQIVQ
jgi:surface protein